MEIPCVYSERVFREGHTIYFCEFIDQNIPENIMIIPNGLHARKKKKKDINVGGVIFSNCNLTKVPQGLVGIFPNIRLLIIYKADIRAVTKNELAEYKNIEIIGFCETKIDFLPGDLFEGFENLEEISFTDNQLTLVEPNILDGLTKLISVDFTDNPSYNIHFSKKHVVDLNVSLEELKASLIDKYYEFHENKEFAQIHSCRMQNDMNNLYHTDDTFKDFRISIKDREFMVHKVVIAARSPTFAEILRNNPAAENLNLVDVSFEVFEKILHFLYTDQLPSNEGINMLDLFSAAGRLKIQMLMDYSAKKLIETIEKENAFNFLKLANKYDHDELRQAAFATIKSDYVQVEFEDEWACDADKLIKIINAYKTKVKMIKKADEDFKNYVRNC